MAILILINKTKAYNFNFHFFKSHCLSTTKMFLPFGLGQASVDGHCKFPLHLSGKVLELMAALELVQTYLDYLLCITRSRLDNHLEHLRFVLTRVQEVGFKVSAPKLKL